MLFLWKDKERHIVDLMRKGVPSAMDKFYQEYADYLTGVCARYISDEDTLKDVMQESLVKIFTQFHQFEYRGKGSLKAWITKVAVNEALTQLQKEKQTYIALHGPDIENLPDEEGEEPDTDGVDTGTLLAFVRVGLGGHAVQHAQEVFLRHVGGVCGLLAVASAVPAVQVAPQGTLPEELPQRVLLHALVLDVAGDFQCQLPS